MAHWQERWSKSKKKIFYLNKDTKESVWERPEGVEIEPLQQSQSQSQEQVRASHLLVKHCQSRRPSSWKQAEITRSEQEALKLITEYRLRLVNKEISFQDLASTESD